MWRRKLREKALGLRPGDCREIAFAEGFGQVAVDVGERLVDAGRHEAGRVRKIAGAGQRADIGGAAQDVDKAHEERDAADALRLDKLGKHRTGKLRRRP